MSAKRLTPFSVRRSPQFIASFSKTALGSVPTRRGASGSRTFQTCTLSTPLVTKSGAVFMKQPEMPAVPGGMVSGTGDVLDPVALDGGGAGALAQGRTLVEVGAAVRLGGRQQPEGEGGRRERRHEGGDAAAAGSATCTWCLHGTSNDRRWVRSHPTLPVAGPARG